MDEYSLIIRSLIDSELDDMILDLVYEIHSSIKGISQDQIQINNSKTKTISIEKQTCTCPNCGQTNLIATRFAYHLAKCLGAGRQSSRQAQRRIIDQIMIITDSDENQTNGNHFYKDIEINLISEDGSSCTDSTSSTITLTNSNKTHFRLSNDDQEYIEDFDNDEEDDWKPKKKKRRITTNNKNKIKKKKDLFVVVSPSTSNCIIPLNKICPMSKDVVIPLVALPINSITTSNSDKIFFKTSESSHYIVQSPLNLDEDEQSSIIIFKDDINQ